MPVCQHPCARAIQNTHTTLCMSINTTIRDYHYNIATSKEVFLKIVLVVRNLCLFLIYIKMTSYYKLTQTTLSLLHTTVINRGAVRGFNLHPG